MRIGYRNAVFFLPRGLDIYDQFADRKDLQIGTADPNNYVNVPPHATSGDDQYVKMETGVITLTVWINDGPEISQVLDNHEIGWGGADGYLWPAVDPNPWSN